MRLGVLWERGPSALLAGGRDPFDRLPPRPLGRSNGASPQRAKVACPAACSLNRRSAYAPRFLCSAPLALPKKPRELKREQERLFFVQREIDFIQDILTRR